MGTISRYESHIISFEDIVKVRDVRSSELMQSQMEEILHDAGTNVTSTLDMQEVFDRMLNTIRHLIPLKAVGICIIAENFITIVRSQGYSLHELESLVDFCSKNSIQNLGVRHDLIENGSIIELTSQSPILRATLPDRENLIIAPILFNARTTGLILMHPSDFIPTRLLNNCPLRIFTNQAAIAIENAKLYAQSQRLAVIGERERLARDIHDSVTQALFAASIMAESIKLSLHDSPHDVADILDELHLLMRGALAETRNILLELEPAKLVQTDMPDLLNQLVEAIWSRKQLKLIKDIGIGIELPVNVKIAFYRIAQEAFHNILKHAKASTVTIYYSGNEDETLLVISDDGIGFKTVNELGFGLQNMAYRANKIKAEFEITSAPLDGTTIQLKWRNNANLLP